MELTAELAAQVERTEPDPGPEPGTTEHTSAEFQRMAEQFLAQYSPETLWVFAYGSLIWNPEFEFLSDVKGTALGWHRSFCLSLTRWRGTRELPSLMLALDRGGSCVGIAYELPKTDHKAQIVRLLEREIDAKPPTNVPHWVWVKTETGRVRAVTFIAKETGPAYAGKLPLQEVAYITARAAGHWGSAAIYLQKTISMLESHGIRDKNLWKLQSLVAAEIRKILDKDE